jgi:hypothetical protein
VASKESTNSQLAFLGEISRAPSYRRPKSGFNTAFPTCRSTSGPRSKEKSGGNGVFPFCGQSGSEPKENRRWYKPPLNICRDRICKDGQRCGGRHMRGIQCLIFLTGYRAGSIYGNLGSGCIWPGSTVHEGAMNRRRGRVRTAKTYSHSRITPKWFK